METCKLSLQNWLQSWFCLKIEIELKLSGKVEKNFFYQPKYHFDFPLILYKPFVIGLSFGGSR